MISIYILSVNGRFFEGITMHFNQVNLLHQHALKDYHHSENYQDSILSVNQLKDMNNAD